MDHPDYHHPLLLLRRQLHTGSNAVGGERKEGSRDYEKIAAYGVMTTPALVVDGQVASYGKVLKKDEVIAILRKVRK